MIKCIIAFHNCLQLVAVEYSHSVPCCMHNCANYHDRRVNDIVMESLASILSIRHRIQTISDLSK